MNLRVGPAVAIATVTATLALVAVGCSSTENEQALCQRLGGDAVESLLGDTELETFSVEQLNECVWTSLSAADESITLHLESVPDGQLFVDHAIEATPSDRVEPLDIGDGSVLFTDEAVLGRDDDQIVLLTATIDTDQLVTVLKQALSELNRSQA